MALIAIAGTGFAFLPSQKAKQKPEPWTIVVTGDYLGNLAPCGCTKPMTGGIRRAGTAIRTLGRADHRILLVNGALTGDAGRQQEIKSQHLASSLRSMGVSAINLSADDLRIGVGNIGTVGSLSGNKLISSSVGISPLIPLRSNLTVGPFKIAGVSPNMSQLATGLQASEIRQAESVGSSDVVLFDGSKADAISLITNNPGLKLVVYRTQNDAPDAPNKVGKTWLVSPGVEGKALVAFDWNGREFVNYRVIKLTPKFEDDPDVSRSYKTYLERITEEKLLEALPRTSKTDYVGSQTCQSCHVEAYKVWTASGHSHALASLEKEKHDRDPDCVSCHVVGLDSVNGFQSRALTPRIADVGCESCHGGGKAHRADPKGQKMGKIGEAKCLTCHTPKQSPGFSFPTFWKKISHR